MTDFEFNSWLWGSLVLAPIIPQTETRSRPWQELEFEQSCWLHPGLQHLRHSWISNYSLSQSSCPMSTVLSAGKLLALSSPPSFWFKPHWSLSACHQGYPQSIAPPHVHRDLTFFSLQVATLWNSLSISVRSCRSPVSCQRACLPPRGPRRKTTLDLLGLPY